MRPAPAAALAAALAAIACAATLPSLRVTGEFAGQRVDAAVDSEIARYYVERHSRREPGDPRFDAALAAIERGLGDRVPTTDELAQIARAHSTDLAALIAAERLHGRAQQDPLYRRFRRALHSGATPLADDILFLFVPGWLYRTDPTTGADFAQFRKLLADHGARTALIETGENATVEDNAVLIADSVRRIAAVERRIVLVSGSKGGPEVELALGQLLDAPSARGVVAWVNIGGLLRGTPLADFALSWPARWLVRWAIVPDGSFEGIESLAPARSARRRQALRLPAHVLTINLVAIPLSGQVSAPARSGYARLRAHGPNDGLTFVTDAIAAGGVTIPVLGADHYFRTPDIEAITLALARALAEHVRDRAGTRHRSVLSREPQRDLKKESGGRSRPRVGTDEVFYFANRRYSGS